MAVPTGLPIVTRWATNQITLANGFKNRLSNEPTQDFIEKGFSTNVILRQPLNYVLYNHGENLDYCKYYSNRPKAVVNKSALPAASDNAGVIYYVSNEKKLVMSVDSKWLVVATLGGEI